MTKTDRLLNFHSKPLDAIIARLFGATNQEDRGFWWHLIVFFRNSCSKIHSNCRKRLAFMIAGFAKNSLLLCLFFIKFIIVHSSEIGGLCLMKCPSEILQNLPYFYHKKTHAVFFIFHLVQLYFFP